MEIRNESGCQSSLTLGMRRSIDNHFLISVRQILAPLGPCTRYHLALLAIQKAFLPESHIVIAQRKLVYVLGKAQVVSQGTCTRVSRVCVLTSTPSGTFYITSGGLVAVVVSYCHEWVNIGLMHLVQTLKSVCMQGPVSLVCT